MPIKKAFKAVVPASSSDPRTATFTATGRVTEYQPVPAVIPEQPRNRILQATLDRELSYFYNVANHELVPNENEESPTLVLHLFRATDPGRKPVAERMILGQGQGAPYYALHATPSTTSMDEFNTLQITRRHPITGNHVPICVAEIQPNLDLDFEGTRTIARISRNLKMYNLVRTGESPEDDTSHPNSIALWSEEQAALPVAQFFIDEDWNGLDRSADGRLPHGIIRVGGTPETKM
jgi:hypothetical protein